MHTYNVLASAGEDIVLSTTFEADDIAHVIEQLNNDPALVADADEVHIWRAVTP